MTLFDWFIVFAGLLALLVVILYVAVYCRLLGRLGQENRPGPKDPGPGVE